MAGTGNNNAIGILFGVKGGGSVSGESGQEINRSLDSIVTEINKNPKLISFGINKEYIKKEVEGIGELFNKELANLKIGSSLGESIKGSIGEISSALKSLFTGDNGIKLNLKVATAPIDNIKNTVTEAADQTVASLQNVAAVANNVAKETAKPMENLAKTTEAATKPLEQVTKDISEQEAAASSNKVINYISKYTDSVRELADLSVQTGNKKLFSMNPNEFLGVDEKQTKEVMDAITRYQQRLFGFNEIRDSLLSTKGFGYGVSSGTSYGKGMAGLIGEGPIVTKYQEVIRSIVTATESEVKQVIANTLEGIAEQYIPQAVKKYALTGKFDTEAARAAIDQYNATRSEGHQDLMPEYQAKLTQASETIKDTNQMIEQEAQSQDTVNVRLDRTLEILERIIALKSQYSQLDYRESETMLYNNTEQGHLLANTSEKLTIKDATSAGSKADRTQYSIALRELVDLFNKEYAELIDAINKLDEAKQEIARGSSKFTRMNERIATAAAPKIENEALNNYNSLVDAARDTVDNLINNVAKDELAFFIKEQREGMPAMTQQYGSVFGGKYFDSVIKYAEKAYYNKFKEEWKEPTLRSPDQVKKDAEDAAAQRAAAAAREEARAAAEAQREEETRAAAEAQKQAEAKREAAQASEEEAQKQGQVNSELKVTLELEKEINQEKQQSKANTEATEEQTKNNNSWLSQNLKLVRDYYSARRDMVRIAAKSQDVGIGKDGLFTATEASKYTERVNYINNLISSMQKLGIQAGPNGILQATDEQMQAMAKNLNVSYDTIKNLYAEILRQEESFGASQEKILEGVNRTWANNSAKWSEFIRRYQNTKMTPEQAQMFNELQTIIQSGDPKNLDRGSELYAKLQVGVEGQMSWLTRFGKTFGTRIRSMLAGTVMGLIMRNIRNLYQSVKSIDSALTQLSIVTGESEEKLKSFAQTTFKAAQEIGASATDLLKSAETFARLGYSLEESGTLAKLTSMYASVANTDTNAATTAITSIVKAFDVSADDLESVLDKLVYVGQNYPISAAEIGEGMQNAGSALKAAGNDVTESMALLTAANTTVQNISKSSTGIRTIVARLNASTAELEELGEEVVGVTTKADLDKYMRAFGVNILDANGELRNTYAILKDVSEIWDDLSSVEQSAITKKLAGTRQQNVFSSLMQSFDSAKDVVDSINESEGLLTEATEKRIDSVEGRLNILKATFEELAYTTLEADAVKFVTDLITGILRFNTNLIKLSDTFGGLKNVLGGILIIVSLIKAEEIALVITDISNRIAKLITTVTHLNTALSSTQKVTLILAAIAVTLTALQKAVDQFANSTEKYNKAEKRVSELSDEIDKIDEEISSLEELQKKLLDTGGDKKELAKIYDDLNEKISVSNGLLNGEASAYEAVCKAIEARISLEKNLRQKAVLERAEEYGNQFDNNKVQRKDRYAFDNTFLKGSYSAEQIRALVRGELNGQYQWFTDYRNNSLNGLQALFAPLLNTVDFSKFSYEEFYAMTEEQQDKFLENIEITKEDWDNFWDQQVKIAQEAFEDTVNSSNGFLDSQSYNAFIRGQVLRGYTIDEIAESLTKFMDVDDQLASYENDYNEALANGDERKALEARKQMVILLNNMKLNYSELAPYLDEYIKYLMTEVKIEKNYEVKQRSVLDILEQIQGGYDALISAQKDMDQYGVLSANTLKTILDQYPDLIGYLEQTAAGYVMNANALELYIRGLVDAAVSEINLSAVGSENRENAIQNLKNLQTVLATLAVTTNETKSVADEQKEALEAESDALNEQADAYKQLIDLRKKLLEQYRDEIKYKKQLEEKENNVATLRTEYAVSQLDTSAAGRARSRKLAADLKQAEDELDDFTLEHAIDVVTDELDNQYEEYKNRIDEKLDAIKDAIDAIGEEEGEYSSVFKESIAKMQEWIERLIEQYTTYTGYFNRGDNIVESPNLRSQMGVEDYGGAHLVYDTFSDEDPTEYNVKKNVKDIKEKVLDLHYKLTHEGLKIELGAVPESNSGSMSNYDKRSGFLRTI